MDYEIRKMEPFEVAGMQRSFTSVDGANFRDIPKFWEEVNEDGSYEKMMTQAGGDGPASRGCLGICFDPDGGGTEFDYMIGMTPGSEADLSGLTARTVPERTWAVFYGDEPLPDGIQKIWKAIYAEWFPATEYEHAGGPEIESYFQKADGSGVAYEVWIPVKKG